LRTLLTNISVFSLTWNFASREFGQLASTVGTKLKIVPIEAHHSIGKLERYHGPLRRAYEIMDQELKRTRKEVLLQMALKAINDSVGPNGLVPTLLVFGAYPRMSEYDALRYQLQSEPPQSRKRWPKSESFDLHEWCVMLATQGMDLQQ
jgi:hypothetical protein